ncbi:hypothetical protein Tco_1411072 [Tanacetum coccineum]
MTKNENFLDFKACTPIILKILIKFTTRPLLTNYGTKEVKAQEKIEVATIAAKKVTSLVSVQSPKKIRLLSDKLGAIAKTATNDIIDLQKENKELLKFSKDFFKTYEKLLQEKRALEKEHSRLFRKVNELELEVKKLAKSKEVCQKCDLLPNDWIVDSSYTKHMTRNRRLFTSYKAYDGGHVVFGSNLKDKVIDGGNISHDSIIITNVEHVSGLAFNLSNVLEMVDLIHVHDVDSHQLRMKVFPLSLTDDAWQLWKNEGEGKITIWEELVEKFFCKFYLESYDGEDEMLDERDNWGIDPLEFISRVNSSFDKHIKIDGRTKKVLFHAWMNGNWNKRRIDDSILSSNSTTSDSFFKPYLKTRGKSDTEKEDEQSQTKRKYSNKSSFIDEQPNKRRCKAEKFEAIQYSLGPNEEYIAIRSYEYDIWERNEHNLSIIHQDIFQKKDEGWKILELVISLMPYTMYKKLGLGEPKATRMSLELADMSIQYPGIIENIDVFNKKITLRVGDDEVIFDVDQSIKRPTTEDDECYGIDDLDETINEEARELLTNEEPDSFLSRGLEKSIDQSDLECCESTSSNDKNGSDSENSIRHIDSINTPYPVTQGTSNGDNVKCEHLYSASANEIDEKKPELKNLPQHLEYAYLHGDKSFPIII